MESLPKWLMEPTVPLWMAVVGCVVIWFVLGRIFRKKEKK